MSPRQSQFRRGKVNLATAKLISPRQNHFDEIDFAVSKKNLP